MSKLKGITMERKQRDPYDTFTSTMESMGIQDAIDIYQAAYDRYLNK